MQQLRATTKSLAFPPLSIARYSFIQLSQLERQWRERKRQIFETVAKGDSTALSLANVTIGRVSQILHSMSSSKATCLIHLTDYRYILS